MWTLLGLEHDLGLGVDPSYKPCWDHINHAKSNHHYKPKKNVNKHTFINQGFFLSKIV